MKRPITRRDFVAGAAAASALASIPGAVRAAMGPNDKFDLLIKGGDVLDPSQKLRGVRDIGIRYGMIEAVEADIPVTRAQKVITATGRLVTPGLVDLHAHVFPYGSGIGIPADELVQHQASTTAVSGGDAGANNLAAFRRFVVGTTRSRLFAFTLDPGAMSLDESLDSERRRTRRHDDLHATGVKHAHSETTCAIALANDPSLSGVLIGPQRQLRRNHA